MKVILELGYRKYVLDANVAFTVVETLVNAELYEEVYIAASKSPTGAGQTNHHIYSMDMELRMRISAISDTFYQMAKLAGVPTK